MRLRPIVFGWAVLALGLLLRPAYAGESMEGKNNPVTFDGVVWGFYQYVVEDASTGNQGKDFDFNRFSIDRVYLTFASKLGDRYTGRARLELQNNNDGTVTNFLKTADIAVREPFGLGSSTLRFGQTEGAVSPFLEKPWGYRIVSKTTTDRYLGLSTTYLGAGLASKLAGGIIETDVLLANRVPANKNISDGGDAKYKTLAGRVLLRPIQEGVAKGLAFGGYAQYAPKRSPSGENSDLWFGGHAYFDAPKFVAGVQYDSRVTKVADEDVTSAVISGFARYAVTEKIEIFGRVDAVDFNTDTDDVMITTPTLGNETENQLAQTVLIGGLSHAYSKTLRSIIDVSIRSFSDDLFYHDVSAPARDVEIDLDSEVIVSARLDASL